MSEKKFEIGGYIQNCSGQAFFKLQKPLPPSGKVTFEHAYRLLGGRAQREGHEFLQWLKENHFPGAEWQFYNENDTPYSPPANEEAVAPEKKKTDKPRKKKTEEKKETASVQEQEPTTPAKGAGKVMRRAKQRGKAKGVEITADSMVSPDFNQARDIIDACKDRGELKKALHLSRHVAKKEEHMRYIHTRLQQV